VVNAFFGICSVGADLDWKVELILLIWGYSIALGFGVDDGINAVAEVVGFHDPSRGVEGQHTNCC
jgi:hypothetical protein